MPVTLDTPMCAGSPDVVMSEKSPQDSQMTLCETAPAYIIPCTTLLTASNTGCTSQHGSMHLRDMQQESVQ